MQSQGSLKDFEIIKMLGEGAFGQVFMVKRKQDSKVYALKKVKMLGLKQKQKDNALNQIRILASLNDQYIIKFKEAFYDTLSGFLCIVMEYAGGGDLLKLTNKHIKNRTRIKQQQIWKALAHITKGLKQLHDKKILHRDLKAANIFIGDDGIYKLGDLNVSKVLKVGLAYTQTGTPYYASPQVWQDLPYDMKSDMWSLGCVIYQMAALCPPFKAQDLQGLYKKVKAGIFKPIPSCYSAELGDLISQLLKVRPSERLDTSRILKHPMVAAHLSGEQYFDYKQVYDNPLLKTIKFNHYNLNGLKNKLPKSSYNNQESKNTSRQKDTRDSLDYARQRVLSACGTRRQNGLSPRPIKKQQQKKLPMMPLPLPGYKNLPPRPSKRITEGDNERDPNLRLRKIGQEILEGGRYNNQRSSSVNK